MGFKNMSQKFKATKKDGDTLLLEKKDKDPNSPEIITNPIVDKEKLGTDLSVILHQVLGSVISAAEFQALPKLPISKVDEACLKLISLAR